MKKKLIWKLCIVGFFILSAITFSPIVIPYGVIKPILFGFPRTLWMGILISIMFILLTLLGAYSINNKNDKL